jgi:hypothetical protein
MRKRIINAAQPDPLQTCEWLNIEEIAQVEVSSEDPQYPIESAAAPVHFAPCHTVSRSLSIIRLTSAAFDLRSS